MSFSRAEQITSLKNQLKCFEGQQQSLLLAFQTQIESMTSHKISQRQQLSTKVSKVEFQNSRLQNENKRLQKELEESQITTKQLKKLQQIQNLSEKSRVGD